MTNAARPQIKNNEGFREGILLWFTWRDGHQRAPDRDWGLLFFLVCWCALREARPEISRIKTL